jgi:hypothetical protein
MIVSIMQPYLFPYLGYFQLIAQSDVFVLHDDVNYIKGGWINRNRILREGQPCWMTLPVVRGPHDLSINRRQYQLTRENVGRLLRRIQSCYEKATYFAEAFEVIRAIMTFDDPNVAAFNANSLKQVAAHLDLSVPLIRSSELVAENMLAGEERVIDLCQRLGATDYVNPIGGKDLYSSKRFSGAGIRLRFLEPMISSYSQFNESQVPALSVIDALMFLDKDQILEKLKEFRLVEFDPPQTLYR